MRYPEGSSFESFCDSLERLGSQFASQSDVITTNRLGNSNYLSDILPDLTFPDTSKTVIQYAILSWYVPEEYGILLRFKCQERSKKYGPDIRVIVELLTQTKAQMLIFLNETNLWHTRDFFGSILNKNIVARLSNKEVFRCSVRVKARKSHRRKRSSEDGKSRMRADQCSPDSWVDLTREQMRIYQKRQEFSDTLLFIQGFIT